MGQLPVATGSAGLERSSSSQSPGPGAGHSSVAPRSTASTLERSPVRGLTHAAISGVGSLATLIFSRYSTGV
jgi:hypothetical protein